MSGTHRPESAAQEQAVGPGTGSDGQSSAGDQTERWKFQFWILELHGLPLTIAVYYWLLQRVFPGRGLLFDKVTAFWVGALFAGAGSYLSVRFCTRFGVQAAWQRLLLQFGFSFIAVPLLVLAFSSLTFLYVIPFVWNQR